MQVLAGDSSFDATQGATEMGSMAAVAPWAAFAMIHDRYPTDNAAEADPNLGGLRIRSVQGQLFRNAILRRNRGRDLAGAGFPQTVHRGPRVGVDSAGSVVREMAPLWKPPSGSPSQPGYRDLYGAFAARAAFTIPIIQAFRYSGQLPLDQQPIIKKPNPWDDPQRGRP